MSCVSDWSWFKSIIQLIKGTMFMSDINSWKKNMYKYGLFLSYRVGTSIFTGLSHAMQQAFTCLHRSSLAKSVYARENVIISRPARLIDHHWKGFTVVQEMGSLIQFF